MRKAKLLQKKINSLKFGDFLNNFSSLTPRHISSILQGRV